MKTNVFQKKREEKEMKKEVGIYTLIIYVELL